MKGKIFLLIALTVLLSWNFTYAHDHGSASITWKKTHTLSFGGVGLG
ncbi:MAG: hypothetical protein LUF90_01275 [Rikenellaceae bacterium]|nr:hypothetical protein [Rikenellaceae bacterium]